LGQSETPKREREMAAWNLERLVRIGVARVVLEPEEKDRILQVLESEGPEAAWEALWQYILNWVKDGFGGR